MEDQDKSKATGDPTPIKKTIEGEIRMVETPQDGQVGKASETLVSSPPDGVGLNPWEPVSPPAPAPELTPAPTAAPAPAPAPPPAETSSDD